MSITKGTEIWVEHCGHQTAIWPWAIVWDGYLVCAPNGRAFQYKRVAEAAVSLLKSGELVAVRVAQCGDKHQCAAPGTEHLVNSNDKRDWQEAANQGWDVIRKIVPMHPAESV